MAKTGRLAALGSSVLTAEQTNAKNETRSDYDDEGIPCIEMKLITAELLELILA